MDFQGQLEQEDNFIQWEFSPECSHLQTRIIRWTSWSGLKFFLILPSVFLNGFINKGNNGTTRDICRDFLPGSAGYHHCWRPRWPVSVTNLSPDLLLYSKYPTSQVVVDGPLALCSLSTLKMTYSRFRFSFPCHRHSQPHHPWIHIVHTHKKGMYFSTEEVILEWQWSYSKLMLREFSALNICFVI